MLQDPIQKMTHPLAIVVIVLLGLLSTACSENDEQSLEISNPTSCVFPGRLQLDNDTKERLKRYQRSENQSLIPQLPQSPVPQVNTP